jgi:HlyD family secretion protein
LILAGCAPATETPTPDWTEDYVPVVSVTGELVPAVWTDVSAQVGGTVVEVAVEPGSEVAEGEMVVRLDSLDAQLVVQQAETALQAAQAQLALVQAGVRPEEVAVAQEQIAAAEAAVAQAVAQRDRLYSGATEAEIAAAEAQLAAALAEQRVAREQHDQTMKCYDVPGSDDEVCPLLGPAEEQARYALHAADEAVTAAQAQLDLLLKGANVHDLRAAEAAVAAAEAQRDIAQAQLALLRAEATDEAVAVAQAAVAQAEVAVTAAQVALARAEVQVPFAGTVGAVYVRVGELIAPGQPLITLGDLATLRVETTDLDEIDVARVALGQQVDVTFDALPEQVFIGRVTRIAPMAAPGSGGVNYTVVIALDEVDPVLRWGMTAFVDIEVDQ